MPYRVIVKEVTGEEGKESEREIFNQIVDTLEVKEVVKATNGIKEESARFR